MSEVSHILCAIEQGDPSAAEQLLPLVFDEMRQWFRRAVRLWQLPEPAAKDKEVPASKKYVHGAWP
jgi:hypothetical protein